MASQSLQQNFMQSFWALGAAASFSVMAACIKLSAVDLSTFELVFYRSVFSALSIAFVVASRGGTLKTRYFEHHILRSVLGVLSVALWFWALGRMQFASCMTLTYTTPLFMAATFTVAALLKGRRAPWMMTASILVGFVGIVAILRPSISGDELVPALMCLSVAAIDLVTYWQMKRMGRLNEPSWRIVFYFSVLGIAFALVGIALTGGFHALDLRAAAGVLAMGFFATVGQICTTKSYAYGNLLLSSCLGFSAIPFSAVTGVLLFGDALQASSMLGMTLIVISGMAASVSTKREQARQKSEGAS